MPSSPSSAVTVVIDTREQEPYGFNPDMVRPVRRALPAGDYSIDGLEETIAVERKTLDDFVGTVMRARGRFYRELRRLGATVRPTIWPTAILHEGDSLAFDILAVASPGPGSDLTVVIQT